MNAPLSSQISNERLALLYHLSQTFNSSLDLNQVLNAVIDEIIAATHAERGFVVLREEGQLVFKAARGLNQTNIDDPQFQVSRGVVDQVIREGQPVLTSNAQIDSRFSGLQSVAFLGLSSVMCAPLKVRDVVLGAVYVENRIQAGIFRNEHLDLLNAIASSAAIAIENARLYQVAVEKGRLEREMQVARQVQSSFIPREICHPVGWEITAHLEPAREVGGDFYDAFDLPESQRIGLVVADVCDKGVGAALFMALFRSLIRAFAGQNFSRSWMSLPGVNPEGDEVQPSLAAALKSVISLTNDYIAIHHGDTSMFATLFFGILNPATGELVYINGGHEPPVIAGAQGVKERLMPTGPALGLFPDVEFTIGQTRLEPGDILLAYTDGVTDALSAKGETFGEDGLLKALQPLPASSEKLVEKLKGALGEHMQGKDQFDDITLLVVRRE
jgi:sigma-B regulation protein RsbU (phosphoserine phosphatase)